MPHPGYCCEDSEEAFPLSSETTDGEPSDPGSRAGCDETEEEGPGMPEFESTGGGTEFESILGEDGGVSRVGGTELGMSCAGKSFKGVPRPGSW